MVKRSRKPATAGFFSAFKNISLYPNWKTILKKAWSMRFMALAAFFNAATVVIALYSYKFPELHGNGKIIFATAAFICTSAAFISRIIYQKDL